MGAIDNLAARIATSRNAPLWLYLVTDRRRTRRTHEVAHTLDAAKKLGAARLNLPLGEVVTTRVRLFAKEA